MVEHVLSALAGLWIDNTLIQIDAPEPPGGDGSSLFLADAPWEAGLETQSAPRACHAVDRSLVVEEQPGRRISVAPTRDGSYRVSYVLDYGHPAIPPQRFETIITPETYIEQIAFARTFVLEEEVRRLQAQGSACGPRRRTCSSSDAADRSTTGSAARTSALATRCSTASGISRR